jgi:hypothetical protein
VTAADLYRLRQPTLDSATRIAIQLDIFERLKEAGSNGIGSASDRLATATGGDPTMLSMFL